MLPIKEHGFCLHKEAFRDALCLRYGWKPNVLPTTCACGQQFNIEHALSCKLGGFQTRRHNEVRDSTARMMAEVCHNVSVEPHLQPLSGENMHYNSAITEDNARLDIKASGFWEETITPLTLMSGFSIHLLPATTQQIQQVSIKSIKRRKREPTSKG